MITYIYIYKWLWVETGWVKQDDLFFYSHELNVHCGLYYKQKLDTSISGVKGLTLPRKIRNWPLSNISGRQDNSLVTQYQQLVLGLNGY